MNWDDLRVFLAVFREGSFSEASRKLHLSQSTVSRRIAGLERALGVRLFDRTPGGLLPTEVAKDLQLEAELTEQSTIEILRLAEGRENQLEGIVRVAMSDGFSANLIAPVLSVLTQRYPEIRLEILAGNALADLSRREADVALRFVKPISGDLVFRRVAQSDYGLYACPVYLERFGCINDWKELDWLTWDHSLAHLPESRWFAQNIGVVPRLRSTHMDTLMNAAIAGLGVLLLPKLFASWISLLTEVPLEVEIPMQMDVWLVGHQTLRHIPRFRVVWEFLEELLEEIQHKTPETSELFAGLQGPASWIFDLNHSTKRS